MNQITDIPVYPQDLMRVLGISHTSSLRRQIAGGKIPDYDKKVTQKTRYWFRSTLVKHGLLPAAEPAAAPSLPTPAE